MVTSSFKRLKNIAILLLASSALFAQDYKFEIGAGAGGSFYMGDANKGLLFKNTRPSAGVVFRYNANFRWAFKADLAWAGISGSSNGLKNAFPNNAGADFNRDVIDLGGQMEFNFFPYSDEYTYLNAKRLTPYLMLGLGLTIASEGNEAFYGMNVPIGIGAKYKLKERLNLGIEFSFRKLFGDGLEGVGLLDDPYELNGSRMKNNDWYSMVMFSITWDFGLRCMPCNK